MKIKETFSDQTLNLAFDTLKKGKQAIIFANTKASAEKTAEDIALKVKENDKKWEALSEKVLNTLSRPTKQCHRLAKCVIKGMAFHHAGLAAKQKELIQDEFRNGNIKIIAATPTLAAGVDLPAFRTILKSLHRFTARGMEFIPVLEYLQMAGRAGRPKFDKSGEAVVIAKTEAEKNNIWKKYIMGEPEEIYSKLAAEPALRFYLLSLIAGNFVRTKKEIMDFFKETFWAHQYGDMHQLEVIIDRMLDLLDTWEFIRQTGKSETSEAFVSADELSKDSSVKYKATPIGRRVSELYLDPLTAHEFIIALRRAKKDNHIFSFLQMVAFTIELRPLLRVKVREYERILEKYAKYEDDIITSEPSRFDIDYDEFINSVKTALFFLDWTEEKIEDFLLETYDIRPGEVRVKLDIADWLLYASVEISKILQFRDVTKQLNRTRMRLKYGVKEELLPLLKLKGIGRVRARKLFNNGFKSISSVKKGDLSPLRLLLGKKTAENVKKQLGEKVEKVKPKKRKGQKNVMDF